MRPRHRMAWFPPSPFLLTPRNREGCNIHFFTSSHTYGSCSSKLTSYRTTVCFGRHQRILHHSKLRRRRRIAWHLSIPRFRSEVCPIARSWEDLANLGLSNEVKFIIDRGMSEFYPTIWKMRLKRIEKRICYLQRSWAWENSKESSRGATWFKERESRPNDHSYRPLYQIHSLCSV